MKRIIIKLSGEGLANKQKSLAIDPEIVSNLVEQIKRIIQMNVQVGIVIGGGNFWRGASAEKNGMPRTRADYVGMLATIMNGLALMSAFEQIDTKARIFSAIPIDDKVAETYVVERVDAALKKGEIAIFTGGTGRPYFTTDTCATLVASELKADAIIMGKNGVSGVYDSDPKLNPNAKKYDVVTYDELLAKGLMVMDGTAAAMARENDINLIVFNIKEDDSIIKAVKGEIDHTKVVKERK